jgi:hypothetical protein
MVLSTPFQFIISISTYSKFNLGMRHLCVFFDASRYRSLLLTVSFVMSRVMLQSKEIFFIDKRDLCRLGEKFVWLY